MRSFPFARSDEGREYRKSARCSVTNCYSPEYLASRNTQYLSEESLNSWYLTWLPVSLFYNLCAPKICPTLVVKCFAFIRNYFGSPGVSSLVMFTYDLTILHLIRFLEWRKCLPTGNQWAWNLWLIYCATLLRHQWTLSNESRHQWADFLRRNFSFLILNKQAAFIQFFVRIYDQIEWTGW